MASELNKLSEKSESGTLDNTSVWSLTTIAKTLLLIDKQSKENPDGDDLSNLTPEELDRFAKEAVADMKERMK